MGIRLMPGLSARSIHNGRNQVAQPLAVNLGFKAHGHALLLQGIEKAFCAVNFVALCRWDFRLAFIALVSMGHMQSLTEPRFEAATG